MITDDDLDLTKINIADIWHDIWQRHRRIDHRVCNARSVGPVTVKHSGDRWEARVLRCTVRIPEGQENHEGNHRDAACCFVSHEFLPAQAHSKWAITDNSRCSTCNQAWPCDAVKLLALIESERMK